MYKVVAATNGYCNHGTMGYTDKVMSGVVKRAVAAKWASIRSHTKRSTNASKSKKSIAKKPIVKKPIAKKPIAKKPIAKKPIAKKPIAKKPIAKKLTKSATRTHCVT